MKKNTKVLLFAFSFLFAGMFMGVGDVLADPVTYELLENIPGTAGLGSDLPQYLSAVYKVALVVVTLSAVLMLSIGGFMYLTSAGNTSSISTAKGIIADSLIGLVIALSAWLILYIINPDLIEISLTPLPSAEIVNYPAPAPGDTTTLPPAGAVELATQILANRNITLQGDGQADCSSKFEKVSVQRNMQDIADGTMMTTCYNGCNKPGANYCTSVSGMSEKMLKAIWTVGQTESFTITSIGGGSHAGGPNSTHYNGRAIDIAPVTWQLLRAFIEAGAIPPSLNGTETCVAAHCGNGNAASMCELNGKNVGCTAGSGANHIHLIFPN